MAMSSVVRHIVKLSRGREGLRHGYCLYLVMTRKHTADTANQTFVHILVNRQILRKQRKKSFAWTFWASFRVCVEILLTVGNPVHML